MSAATDIIQNHQHSLDTLTLQTGTAGIFDVSVDGHMIFSKDKEGRHANDGEVLQLFEAYIASVQD